MVEILITAGLIILIVSVICLFVDAKELAFLLCALGTYLLSGGIMQYDESCRPTAMDVYHGKTILEYTVKDGVVTDSVVVFKDKEK